MTSSSDYWEIAASVCTANEVHTLRLRDRGLSLRQISLASNLSIATIRSRLFNADRKINQELGKEAAT